VRVESSLGRHNAYYGRRPEAIMAHVCAARVLDGDGGQGGGSTPAWTVDKTREIVVWNLTLMEHGDKLRLCLSLIC
jgi:hypothetical protein